MTLVDKRAHWLLLAFVSAACSGCSMFGGLFGGSSSHEPLAPLPALQADAKAANSWNVVTGKATAVALGPAVGGETVYTASDDGQIAAFDAASGRQRWRVETKVKLSAGPGIGQNLILVGTRKGSVVAYDSQGKRLWQTALSSEVVAVPQVLDGIVVTRTGDGKIYGLDAGDGKSKWTQQRSTPVLTLRSHGGIALAKGIAYVAFPGGKLLAFNLSSGGVLWEATVALPRGSTELERITDVIGTPVVDERQICAVAFQGRLACFGAADGKLLWSREVSSGSGLAQDAANLYVSDDRGAVLAFDKAGGASLWKQERLQGRKLSAPALLGAYVLLGDVQGVVHALSVASGELAGRVATDGSPVTSQPAVAADLALVQTHNGGLFAVSAR
jgi:outer membrane protein assembly factor BamB